MRSPSVRADAVQLFVIAAAAIYALAFHITLPAKLPSEADHQAAAKHLADHAQPTDAILLHPWWTDRARLFVPGSLSLVGYLGSERDDLDAHPRVWTLTQRSLPRTNNSAFDAAFLPGRTRVDGPHRFGPLELSLYTNGRYRPAVFQATTLPAPFTVYVERPDGVREACPWDGRAHRCGQAFVTAPEWHEVFYRPLRCLYFRPPGGDSKIVAELSAPEAMRVRLQAGVIWEHAPRTGGGRTEVQVGVEGLPGKTAAEVRIPPGEEGMKVDEQAWSGEAASLRVWVQSVRTEDRDVCVDVQLFAGTP